MPEQRSRREESTNCCEEDKPFCTKLRSLWTFVAAVLVVIGRWLSRETNAGAHHPVAVQSG